MSHYNMLNYPKSGMKHIVKKLTYEAQPIKELRIFTRAKVGSHLGMILEEGKENSLIIGITHSKTLPEGIETLGCDFSSLGSPNITTQNKLKNLESRAVLTIVNNKTMQYKNQKILSNLIYKTGLINHIEQEKLKEKILLNDKITYLSNAHTSKDTYILYQTKTKTEAIPISDSKRIIQLIGLEMYNKHFEELLKLSETLGERRLAIADILKKQMKEEGIGKIIKIIEKITS